MDNLEVLIFGEKERSYSKDLKKRTKEFAHRCVRLSLSIQGSMLGDHIAKQLMRSATSVAANYRAACMAQSKSAFIAKVSIVLEEVDEVCFWIEFAVEEGLEIQQKCDDLFKEALELTAIFFSSRKTAIDNNKKS